MKKLILSCTLACFSLFGKRGIVDAYNHIPTKPESNDLLHTVSTPTNNNIENIAPVTQSIDLIDPVQNAIDQSNTSLNQDNTQLTTIASETVPSLIDVATVADILPKIALAKIVPLNNVLPDDMSDITSIPHITNDSPVLVVANTLPVNSSFIENFITDVLQGTAPSNKINCYKIIPSSGKTTQYIFVPAYASKNPLTNMYEAICELVNALALKLQELFGKNTEQATLDIINEIPEE